MKLDNSMEEPDDDDDDDDDDDIEFPPLPSNIEIQSYANTPDPYDNRNHALELFYCPSPPLPSPPPPTSSATMTRIYANARTISSLRSHASTNQPIVSFATQQRKKSRAPIASILQSVYVNMPRRRSPPPKVENLSNEITYATLMNTTSIAPPVSAESTINHAEYQQVQHKSNKASRIPIYENVKPRRLPPPPVCSPTNTPQRPASWSIIPVENDRLLSPTKLEKKKIISASSAHIYINLEYHNDKPPALPTRTCKSTRIAQTASSPPPPAIPPRNEQKSGIHFSLSSPTTSPVEKEQDVYETTSNASTVQTAKALQVDKSSHGDDKNDLCRTKTPLATTENLPSFANARQRRALQSARRRRLRGSVALRGSVSLRNSARGATTPNTNRQQNSRPNPNVTVRHPMTTDDRWRRTLHKRRRQRALQMKLDGNALCQQKKPMRPVSDHTYNEIKQPLLPNNQIQTNGQAGGVLERAMQFNGALRDRVFSWYRGANHNGRETIQEQTTPTQVLSTSENGESDQKDTTTNEEEEEEEEDEDEAEGEFFTHDTFEDFLLRRRPKSSNSNTTSGTSTVVSHIDVPSQRLPVRTIPNKKIHIPPVVPPPPPPAPPPPLPPTPPPARRLPGLALGLDKTDVDFIHNMLQRTRGDHRVWNRITALKEAYIRATSKKNDSTKKIKAIAPQNDENKKKKAVTMKHSLAATKIRAELEKYDELPASSPTQLDDDDYYDDTCSANNRHKIDFNPHHHSVPTLPRIPTTANRILSFVTSIKRRAQDNVQQLQKNLHEIRSRIHVEAMTLPSNPVSIQRHTSTVSRHRQTFKDSSTTPRTHLQRRESTPNQNFHVRRTNSHRSATSGEHSTGPHRNQFSRTQSNASQIPQQHRHTHRQQSQQRSTNEKTINGTNRSPSLPTRPPPLKRHSIRRTENETNSRQPRSKKTTS